MLCLVEARKRTFAYMIFHSAKNGAAIIYIRQKAPTALHVKEFTEILKEKIVAEQERHRREIN